MPISSLYILDVYDPKQLVPLVVAIDKVSSRRNDAAPFFFTTSKSRFFSLDGRRRIRRQKFGRFRLEIFRLKCRRDGLDQFPASSPSGLRRLAQLAQTFCSGHRPVSRSRSSARLGGDSAADEFTLEVDEKRGRRWGSTISVKLSVRRRRLFEFIFGLCNFFVIIFDPPISRRVVFEFFRPDKINRRSHFRLGRLPVKRCSISGLRIQTFRRPRNFKPPRLHFRRRPRQPGRFVRPPSGFRRRFRRRRQ